MNPLLAKKAAEKLVRSRSLRRSGTAVAVSSLAVFVVGPMFLVTLAMGGLEDGPAPSTMAQQEIPTEALAAYIDAADTYDIDWWILAAIGKVECVHGQLQADGCNPPGTMNHAGARGYMQFIGSTWRRGLGQHELEPRNSPPAPDGHGYATDGDGNGEADPWNWADATHSAARYLVAAGIHTDVDAAIYSYNHSNEYVAQVLLIAQRYRSDGDALWIDSPPDGPVDSTQITTVQGISVHTSIAPNLAELLDAAHTAGFTTLSGWGYRDPAGQIRVRRTNCGTSHYAIHEMPSGACRPPTARPGRSMHERGLAVDFTINGSIIGSRNTDIFAWMAANAPAYGFHNLPSEPWHWSVNGK